MTSASSVVSLLAERDVSPAVLGSSVGTVLAVRWGGCIPRGDASHWGRYAFWVGAACRLTWWGVLGGRPMILSKDSSFGFFWKRSASDCLANCSIDRLVGSWLVLSTKDVDPAGVSPLTLCSSAAA